MSELPRVTKVHSYGCVPLKTPKIKKELISSCPTDKTKVVPPHSTIFMDEYGQMPDHYYLARKPPLSFFQVKRKLDLQSGKSSNKSKIKLNITPRRIVRTRGKRGSTFLEKPRYDTSLGQLTKKFLKLLSDASDGTINLNSACTLLAVPKRRLYDITNVLEGAGLVQKMARNNIQWMGQASSPCDSVWISDLERDIGVLDSKENKLNELIYCMTNEIEASKKLDYRYHYITAEDLKNVEEYAEKTAIGMLNYEFLESFERKLVVSSKSNADIEGHLLCNDGFPFFQNILHAGAECKGNSYDIKIKNSQFLHTGDASEASEEGSSYGSFLNPDVGTDASFTEVCANTIWTKGDTIIKNAFIAEEDDIAPMGKNFLLETEDQDLDSVACYVLGSPIDNYSFSLDTGEGLSDLFDCNFACP
ncbi:transcription factor E2F2-like [Uloborus diversus]|uniref:transcription factor E2F2-like n=1 Tax=Uloborus diversus TaxID=327109 RepID=UPI002409F518|nr:transcription factor E2F2-like [Uloborus diversus]